MIMNWEGIQEQFNKAIAHTQHIDINDLHTDQLFKTWSENKEWIYEKFGGKLVYETPNTVSMSISEKSQDKMFKNFIDYLYDTIYDSYMVSDCETLMQFLRSQKKNFFTNKVDLSNIDNPSIIKEGVVSKMKISKALKFYLHKEDLQKVQEEYSRILQYKNIQGHLCLSIHPLDYITVSENNCGWRSCHALDGEYRTGNLNYMADGVTIVAYLKSGKDECLNKLGGIKWNSKKWRCLLFVSKDYKIITMGKHYPFFSFQIIPHIDHLLDETKLNIYNGYYHNMWVSTFTEIKEERIDVNGDIETVVRNTDKRYFRNSFTGNLRSLNSIYQMNASACYYNDLIYSSDYLPYIKKAEHSIPRENRDERITIGENVYCLSCGERILDAGESMFCPQCTLDKTDLINSMVDICPQCGERFLTEEGQWEYNSSGWEELVCPNCLS